MYLIRWFYFVGFLKATLCNCLKGQSFSFIFVRRQSCIFVERNSRRMYLSLDAKTSHVVFVWLAEYYVKTTVGTGWTLKTYYCNQKTTEPKV